jgi:hypothetical protein
MSSGTRTTWRRPYIKYGKRGTNWHRLFIECEQQRNNGNCHAITDIAERQNMPWKTLRNKYDQWIKAGRPAAGEGDVGSGCSSTRGGHNRAFDKEWEQRFASRLKTEYIDQHLPLSLHDIQLIAQWEHRHGKGATRRSHHHKFVASMGWCHNFIERNNLRQRRPGRRTISLSPDEVKDELAFIASVKDAITKYGADYVLNLDETMWRIIIPVLTILARRGDPSPFLNVDCDLKKGMTAACIVSASGRRLPVSVITKGKTQRCLKKLGAGRYPNDVVAKYTANGWMTSKMLCEIITDVIVPYCDGHSCALIIDQARSHMADEVKDACAKASIKLIYVPSGLTATRQPLDIGGFGPMKSHARHAWRIARIHHIDHTPTFSDAVAIMVAAWKKIKARTIRHAFRRAFDMDRLPTSSHFPAPAVPLRPGNVSLGAYRSDGVENKDPIKPTVAAAVVSTSSKKRPRAPSPYVHPIEDPYEGFVPQPAASSSSSSSTAVRSADGSDCKRSTVQLSTKRPATVPAAAASSSRKPVRHLYHREDIDI